MSLRPVVPSSVGPFVRWPPVPSFVGLAWPPGTGSLDVFQRIPGPEDGMAHHASPDDIAFRDRFEAGDMPPDQFDHRAHVRLAWVYLTEDGADAATARMRDALKRFITRNGIEASKYHETMTSAWVRAVRHFMERTPAARSADAFIEQNPRLLDSKIMMTHYSAELLFSPEARAGFIPPDLDPIPEHGPQA